MKSVFCAGVGIQSILFFLNDGYLPAGRELSPRTRIGPFHRPPYCLRQQGPTPADGPRRNSRTRPGTRGRGCHPAAFRPIRAAHRGAAVCAVRGAAPASCLGVRPCGAAGAAAGSRRRMLPGEPAGGERTRPDGGGHPGRACAAPGAGGAAGRRHPRRIPQRKTGAAGCGGKNDKREIIMPRKTLFAAENAGVLTSGLCCGSIILLL